MPPITWEEKRERLEELVNHYQIVDYAPKAYKFILNACIGALEGNPGNPYILSYWNDLAHDERDLLSGGDGMPFLWGINHGTTMVPIRPIGADPVHHSWLHLVGSLNNHIYGWDGDAWTHECLPLGAEAQHVYGWEEAPCLSGFSPQRRLPLSIAKKMCSVVHLFVCKARSRFAGGDG